jgi:DNA-binding CsgD family transcriptional regulator
MFTQYEYTLFGTNIHLITFSIIIFELVILFYQAISFLSRPHDKDRRRFLILLLLLLQNNIISGIVPDHRILHPYYIQIIYGFGSSVLMSMYFPYYIYKFLNLRQVKFLVYWGVILFLLLPFIFLFTIPCLITKDAFFSVKLFIGFPFIYCVIFIYSLTKDILIKLKSKTNSEYSYFKQKAIGVYIAGMFWVTLPFIALFNADQIMEHVLTNAGFFVMIIIFIRSNILDARREHEKLLKSESELQQTNEIIQIKVQERTKELELSNAKKINAFIEFVSNQKELPKKETEAKKSFEQNCIDYNITDREKEIIKFISEGLSYKEMSQKLNLSEKTIGTHRQNIFKKVDVNNKIDLLNRLFG